MLCKPTNSFDVYICKLDIQIWENPLTIWTTDIENEIECKIEGYMDLPIISEQTLPEEENVNMAGYLHKLAHTNWTYLYSYMYSKLK